jgi:hypothetical protein
MNQYFKLVFLRPCRSPSLNHLASIISASTRVEPEVLKMIGPFTSIGEISPTLNHVQLLEIRQITLSAHIQGKDPAIAKLTDPKYTGTNAELLVIRYFLRSLRNSLIWR